MVYVDDFEGRFRGTTMSHMMADTEAELDEMAVAIGLKVQWKQKHPSRLPHYDVTSTKKRMAVRRGAMEVSVRELIDIMRQKKAKL